VAFERFGSEAGHRHWMERKESREDAARCRFSTPLSAAAVTRIHSHTYVIHDCHDDDIDSFAIASADPTVSRSPFFLPTLGERWEARM
jgi:hypothetical protein